MVRFIPGRVPDAESFFLVAGRSCGGHAAAGIQGFMGIIPSQIREKTPDANTGSGAGVAVFDGSGRIDEIERNASVNSKVPREVVSKSRSPVVNAAIAAVAPFEARAESPAGGETSRIIFCRPRRCRDWGLRERGRAKAQKQKRNSQSCSGNSLEKQFPNSFHRF